MKRLVIKKERKEKIDAKDANDAGLHLNEAFLIIHVITSSDLQYFIMFSLSLSTGKKYLSSIPNYRLVLADVLRYVDTENLRMETKGDNQNLG